MLSDNELTVYYTKDYQDYLKISNKIETKEEYNKIKKEVNHKITLNQLINNKRRF
jgi:hypothetical protein